MKYPFPEVSIHTARPGETVDNTQPLRNLRDKYRSKIDSLNKFLVDNWNSPLVDPDVMEAINSARDGYIELVREIDRML